MKALSKRQLDLHELTGELSDAIGIVECAVKAMGVGDNDGPELIVLELGLKALLQVHRILDRASTDNV